jgi:hypothetical protein
MQEYQVSDLVIYLNIPLTAQAHLTFPILLGALTSPVFQDEKELSAACLIAHLYRPDFNGTLYYDANSRFPRDDVEVFAAGMRNGYDVSEIR